MTGVTDLERLSQTRWWESAACLGADPTLFDPSNHDYGKRPSRADLARWAQARVFCDRCPVRTECLDEAPLTGDVGFRGGLGPHERRGLKPTRRTA